MSEPTNAGKHWSNTSFFRFIRSISGDDYMELVAGQQRFGKYQEAVFNAMGKQLIVYSRQPSIYGTPPLPTYADRLQVLDYTFVPTNPTLQPGSFSSRTWG